ncbi:hypothetical protein ES708_35139 [subsurface metagenome]
MPFGNRQCSACKEWGILIDEEQNIAADHEGHVQHHLFPARQITALLPAEAHLTVKHYAGDQEIQGKGDNVVQRHGEMELIQRFDGKDPETIVRQKQPVRDHKRKMGEENHNKGQQKGFADPPPLHARILPGQAIIGHSGSLLSVAKEMPQQEQDQGDHTDGKGPEHDGRRNLLRQYVTGLRDTLGVKTPGPQIKRDREQDHYHRAETPAPPGERLSFDGGLTQLLKEVGPQEIVPQREKHKDHADHGNKGAELLPIPGLVGGGDIVPAFQCCLHPVNSVPDGFGRKMDTGVNHLRLIEFSGLYGSNRRRRHRG